MGNTNFFPARVPFVGNNGVLTDTARNSLLRIVALLGGVNGILPNSFAYTLGDGTAGTPALFFISEPGLGLYRKSAGVLAIASGGDDVAEFSTDGLKVTDLVPGFIFNDLTGNLDALPALNGQLLVGSTGNNPVAVTLTSGSGIGITNGSGSITLSVQNLDASIITTGTLAAARLPAFTGDATAPLGSSTLTLATVNGTPGSFGSATRTGSFTVNGKGLITASSDQLIAIGSAQVSGVTTNSNAAAGLVGEYTESIIASGSGPSLTTSITANVTSISLTAGDWDVSGTVVFLQNAGTLGTQFTAGLSSVSATLGPEYSVQNLLMAAGVGGVMAVTTPVIRFSLSTTTTVYAVAVSVFTVSTSKVGGFVRARRVR